MAQLFEFTDYKAYMKKSLDERGKGERGIRSRLAEALSCRPGYITQVLEGDSDLSLEQAQLASQFFGQTQDENEYFLLLVIYGRASIPTLRENIQKQIKRRREEQHNLKNRFKVDEVSKENQMLFYSNWIYIAIFTMLGVPKFQTKEAISEHFHLPLKRVSELLVELEKMGLVTTKGNRFIPTGNRTHLGKGSPMLAKHHINWRMQAVQAIEKDQDNFHYSSVISLSEKDAYAVKERLSKALEDIAQIVEPSKDEKVLSLCMDFFEI